MLPIVMLLFFALCLSGGILGMTSVLGPKNPTAPKLAPYECGVKNEGNARRPFKIDFYLVAVLFLLFDVEAAFFLPWAMVYRDSLKADTSLLWAMVIYMGLLVLSLCYVFRKNVLRLR